jgi:ferrous iron transport protein A
VLNLSKTTIVFNLTIRLADKQTTGVGDLQITGHHLQPTWSIFMALPISTPSSFAATGAEVPLSSLAPGSRARVVALSTSTPEGIRLFDLGFAPGTEIQVLRRAPLGDPTAFYLRGSQICLRSSEAKRVQVRRLVPAGDV